MIPNKYIAWGKNYEQNTFNPGWLKNFEYVLKTIENPIFSVENNILKCSHSRGNFSLGLFEVGNLESKNKRENSKAVENWRALLALLQKYSVDTSKLLQLDNAAGLKWTVSKKGAVKTVVGDTLAAVANVIEPDAATDPTLKRIILRPILGAEDIKYRLFFGSNKTIYCKHLYKPTYYQVCRYGSAPLAIRMEAITPKFENIRDELITLLEN